MTGRLLFVLWPLLAFSWYSSERKCCALGLPQDPLFLETERATEHEHRWPTYDVSETFDEDEEAEETERQVDLFLKAHSRSGGHTSSSAHPVAVRNGGSIIRKRKRHKPGRGKQMRSSTHENKACNEAKLKLKQKQHDVARECARQGSRQALCFTATEWIIKQAHSALLKKCRGHHRQRRAANAHSAQSSGVTRKEVVLDWAS